MMRKQVLISGGAGFIGSHLVDDLLHAGHGIRAIDSLVPQVHGPDRRRPAHLDVGAELVRADLRDETAVVAALEDVDVVYHFGAAVGDVEMVSWMERQMAKDLIAFAQNELEARGLFL